VLLDKVSDDFDNEILEGGNDVDLIVTNIKSKLNEYGHFIPKIVTIGGKIELTCTGKKSDIVDNKSIDAKFDAQVQGVSAKDSPGSLSAHGGKKEQNTNHAENYQFNVDYNPSLNCDANSSAKEWMKKFDENKDKWEIIDYPQILPLLDYLRKDTKKNVYRYLGLEREKNKLSYSGQDNQQLYNMMVGSGNYVYLSDKHTDNHPDKYDVHHGESQNKVEVILQKASDLTAQDRVKKGDVVVVGIKHHTLGKFLRLQKAFQFFHDHCVASQDADSSTQWMIEKMPGVKHIKDGFYLKNLKNNGYISLCETLFGGRTDHVTTKDHQHGAVLVKFVPVKKEE